MDDPTSVPLGFWLRRVDALFENHMDDLFAPHGLSRRDWQVLSTVDRNTPAAEEVVVEAMAMFADPDAAEDPTPARLAALASHGLLHEADDSWTLTESGGATLTELQGEVAGLRDRMFAGVPDDDYATTVGTLARITTNLDPDGSAPQFH